MAKFTQVFSLSIYKDRITLAPEYKQELTNLIFEMERSSLAVEKRPDAAWLGDTRGHEFLFKHERFKDLYRQIGQKIREYTDALGIDNRFLDFYFQRSWATITRRNEQIHEHAHVQSNISFAYYLRKPPNSGGIYFITENHPNEFSPGIFSPAKANLGFIKSPGLLTWNRVLMETHEDEIVIFPSKTVHATAPNPTDDARISISADVSILLKSSMGHETLMPHFSNWISLDDF